MTTSPVYETDLGPYSVPAGATSEPDEDLLTAEDRAGESDLEALARELKAEAAPADLVLEVPRRPGYALRFRTDLSGDELAAARKRARDPKSPDGIDNVRLAALVVVNTNTGMLRGGELVEAAGEPLTLRSRELLDLLGADRAAAAARKFYGRDGDLDAAARAVMAASGWGGDLADPTEQ